jgi:hypothetical protein
MADCPGPLDTGVCIQCTVFEARLTLESPLVLRIVRILYTEMRALDDCLELCTSHTDRKACRRGPRHELQFMEHAQRSAKNTTTSSTAKRHVTTDNAVQICHTERISTVSACRTGCISGFSAIDLHEAETNCERLRIAQVYNYTSPSNYKALDVPLPFLPVHAGLRSRASQAAVHSPPPLSPRFGPKKNLNSRHN